MSLREKNPVYKYFVESYDTKEKIRKFECTTCHKFVKWTGSPQNLVNHLNNKHKKEYKEFEVANVARKRKSADPPNITQTKRPAVDQPQIQLTQLWGREKVMHQKMAKAFAMNGLSIRLTECPHFREFIQAAQGFSLPSRITLRKEMVESHSHLKGKIISVLKQNNSPVSIVLDGWTNVNKVKVTNLLLVSQGVAYYWKSICNSNSKNDSSWLYSALKPQFDEVLEEGIPIVSYVADNENLMGAVHNKLLVDYPFLIRIPCAAHSIQLAVRKILTHPSFKFIVEEVIELINLFINNKAQRLLLINAQPESSRLCLIRPCDTRWSYTLYAIQRLLKLRNFVDTALRQGKQHSKGPGFWGRLKDLAIILKPFAQATDVIQKDSATLFDVGQQFKFLEDHAGTLHTFHSDIELQIKQCLKYEWDKHINEKATIATAILSGVVDFKKSYEPEKVMEAQDYIIDWGVIYLTYYEFSYAEDVKTILTNQLLEFISRTKRFQNFDERINCTKKNTSDASSEFSLGSPVHVWHYFRQGAAELSRVAVAFLSICASEAPAERSFSIQDRIHSKTRNRSKDDLVEAQVFVKFNTMALENKDRAQTDLIEIKQHTDCEPVSLTFLKRMEQEEQEEEEEDEGKEAEEQEEEEEEERKEEEEKEGQEEIDEEKQEEEESEIDDIDDSILDDEEPIPPKTNIATEQDVKSFLLNYMKENKLPKPFKIYGDRENHLADAIAKANPRITHSLTSIKKIIKSMATEQPSNQIDTM